MQTLRSVEVERLFKQGQSTSIGVVTLRFQKISGEQCGISILVPSKTIPTAVYRNKMRRQIREFVRKEYTKIQGARVAIIVRSKDIKQVKADLVQALRKAGLS